MDSYHSGRVARYWWGGAMGFEQHEIRVRAVQEASRRQETENQRLLNEYLTKIKVQLTESKSIYHQLTEQYLEPGWGILESYVIKARRDGSAKNTLMFAFTTDLVGRDSKIAELLEGYAPYASATEFKTQSDEFLEHARTYVLRFGVLPQGDFGRRASSCVETVPEPVSGSVGTRN
ncbi:hypothetical protein SBA2_820008 [Acidobacteriia bacterium SbA2]|nr:hypothetical protein SBA2_820008 [Acidobacteriia bacterium SbA2]